MPTTTADNREKAQTEELEYFNVRLPEWLAEKIRFERFRTKKSFKQIFLERMSESYDSHAVEQNTGKTPAKTNRAKGA